MEYTFGTDQLAAQRLENIADFFNPLAAQFLPEFVRCPVVMGLDMGCGPGFSTDMLARVLVYSTIYGIDNSPRFLAMARSRYPRYTFIEHDVMMGPLPVRPQVIYVRFLLSHLTNVLGLVQEWLGQLLPHGLLFIEE